MKETIEKILPLWGMENESISQIYPSAWEINNSYVIKVYRDKRQLERNIKILKVLAECNIPVAEVIPTKAGENFGEYEHTCFLMSKKLYGSNLTDRKDEKTAWKMGYAIARLHRAFMQCENEVEFWDNSLLDEMQGWVRKNFIKNEWKITGEEEYLKTVKNLEDVYEYLPRQLIHRDVHFGNFLFRDGELSGYIDFDLSQKNIRIFDICYFLAGLLAEETEVPFTKNEWVRTVKAVTDGYESIIRLDEKEKFAIPCVMECIEILFVAYFVGVEDFKLAQNSHNTFLFIQNYESEIRETLS
jgi:Ser/Thr protein kinase RdoA (MazF antagonist)